MSGDAHTVDFRLPTGWYDWIPDDDDGISPQDISLIASMTELQTGDVRTLVDAAQRAHLLDNAFRAALWLPKAAFGQTAGILSATSVEWDDLPTVQEVRTDMLQSPDLPRLFRLVEHSASVAALPAGKAVVQVVTAKNVLTRETFSTVVYVVFPPQLSGAVVLTGRTDLGPFVAPLAEAMAEVAESLRVDDVAERGARAATGVIPAGVVPSPVLAGDAPAPRVGAVPVRTAPVVDDPWSEWR